MFNSKLRKAHSTFHIVHPAMTATTFTKTTLPTKQWRLRLRRGNLNCDESEHGPVFQTKAFAQRQSLHCLGCSESAYWSNELDDV